jgi:hypothetical protein
MYGHSPKSVFVVFANALPGKDEEYNHWCDHVHIPDAVNNGVFDRAFRYKAVGQTRAVYLNVWEADTADLSGGLSTMRGGASELRARGRISPVFEVVWSQVLVAVGPMERSSGNGVAAVTMLQSNWRPPVPSQRFSQWQESVTRAEAAAADSHHSAYRYESYDQSVPETIGRFMALYESALEPAAAARIWKGAAEPGPSPFGKYTTIFGDGDDVPQAAPESSEETSVATGATCWASHWLPLTSPSGP